MNTVMNQPMDILNLSICGFHQYSFQAPVHLSFVSQNLCKMLGLEEADLLSDDTDLYISHIHRDDRICYQEFLGKVMAEPCSKTLQYRLVGKEGKLIFVSDTITSQQVDNGSLIGNSVLTELTYLEKSNDYLSALQDVYDKIFQYNFLDNTVTCIHCSENSRFQWVQNIPMAMETATEKWITDTLIEEDRPKLQSFFRDYCQNGRFQKKNRPVPITYSAKSFSGLICRYRGLFLKLDTHTHLYCCRCVSDTDSSARQKQKKMEQLLQNFTDGIAAFEIADGFVTPLYASDNVCRFFGFTKAEWLALMERKTPITEFVSHCDVDWTAFQSLLETGKGEFPYLDLRSDTRMQIKAICSTPAHDGSRFVMLYRSTTVPTQQDRLVSIRTFGYFDVFVGENPIPFRNQKSKELLALLVDRKGGFLSSQEAIGFLWEDEPVNSVTLARYRKVALRLKNTLESYGIAHIIECVDGKRRIVPNKVQCDLYDYLSGQEGTAHLFKGSYLTNYSWSEYTLAELTGKIVLD